MHIKTALALAGTNPTGDGLTAMQKRLVEHLVHDGVTQTEAARLAGFSEKSAKSAGHKTMKKPAAVSYKAYLLAASLDVSAIKALKKVSDLSDAARSEYVQLEASKDLLNRAGLTMEGQSTQGNQGVSININLGGGSEKPIVDVSSGNSHGTKA